MTDSQAGFNEAHILKLAKQGDAEAFGQLYDVYAEYIFRFLYPQLPTRMDAEDLTSEVFLRAWRSLPKYQAQGYPFSAFLYRIARNLVIDHYRHAKRTGHRETDLGDQIPNENSSLREVFSAQEEHQQLYAVVSKLKESYRTVLILRFLNGLSVKETAKIMKRSQGAVRVLQHRALLKMRTEIETNAEET